MSKFIFVALVLSVLFWYSHASSNSSQIPQVVRTPDSRFDILPSVDYPWPPSYLCLNITGLPPIRLHYLDLGSSNANETLLLLHGTPSWSFLYRLMVNPLLAEGYRVVTLDFVGYGRSDKLTNRDDYSHDLQVQSLLQLIQHLNLQNVTLWGHDLGGPVGLSVVRREPFRFKRLILYNTWIPQGDICSSPESIRRNSAYLQYRNITRGFGLNHPLEDIFSTFSSSTPAEVEAYISPYPNSYFRAGLAASPLLVPVNFDDPAAAEMQAVRRFLLSNWTGPALFGYGEGELFTITGVDVFREVFNTTGCEVNVENGAHFLPDDAAPQMINLTVAFINGGCEAVV